jgi:DNA-binding NarL/FixJ family response regulator
MPNSRKSDVKTARVLIVDDHPAVRDGLALRISGQPDLEVCGEACDLAEAMKAVEVTHPDVAVVDLALKNGNGIDLIKRIKVRFPEVRMLVWSMFNETLYAERALRAGALGFINKEQATEQIITAIRSVLEGRIYLSESVSGQLLGRLVGDTGSIAERSPINTLSDRELEVFRHIGEGLDTHEVAARMTLSPKTIETYRARIKEKLHLDSGIDLLRYAIQWVLEERG